MYLRLQYNQPIGVANILDKMERMRHVPIHKVYNFEHLPPIRWLMNDESQIDRLPSYAPAGFQSKSGSKMKAIYVNETGWWIAVDGLSVSFSGPEFLFKMFWQSAMETGLERWVTLSPIGEVLQTGPQTPPWL